MIDILTITDSELTNEYSYKNRYQTQVLFDKAQILVFLIIQIFITAIIFLVSYTIFNYFVSRKLQQFGILKSLGFKQKEISKVLLLITIIIGTVDNTLAVIISRIGLSIFQRIMTHEDGTQRLKIVINMNVYTISIVLVFIAIGFSTLLILRKLRKINIINLIKEK